MTVDDLLRGDLARLEAWNSATHLKSVATYLDRRDSGGDAEYLVVRDENDDPVCKGAVDYGEHPAAGTIVQVGTRTGFEGRGLATMLMAEAERRIAARGLRARLGVATGSARHSFTRVPTSSSSPDGPPASQIAMSVVLLPSRSPTFCAACDDLPLGGRGQGIRTPCTPRRRFDPASWAMAGGGRDV